MRQLAPRCVYVFSVRLVSQTMRQSDNDKDDYYPSCAAPFRAVHTYTAGDSS